MSNDGSQNDGGSRQQRDIEPPLAGPKAALASDSMLLLFDLITHWRQSVFTAGVTGVLALVLSFIPQSQYTSRASFMPEQPHQTNQAGGLLGVASQLGLGVAGNTATPQLYAELVRSVTITDFVLSTDVHGNGKDVATLASFMQEGARPNSVSWEKARAKLSANTSATVNPRTNVISLQVRMSDSATAQAAVRRYMEALELFNRTTRRTSARARREFLSRRLGESRDSLHLAENETGEFLASNRTFESTPSLRFAYDRLLRRLQGFQEVFVSLRSELEIARLDEVNEQPLLTTIDAPSLPVRAEFVNHAVYLTFGIGIAILGFLLVALVRVTFVRLLVSDPVEYERIRKIFGRWPGVGGLIRGAERSVAAWL